MSPEQSDQLRQFTESRDRVKFTRDAARKAADAAEAAGNKLTAAVHRGVANHRQERIDQLNAKIAELRGISKEQEAETFEPKQQEAAATES